jgi:predicted RNA-binding protein with RPS1 domain
MMMETIHFDDKVIIECLKNGQKVEAEVLSFKENEFLSVVVQKTAKINMQWNNEKDLYIGRQVGLEFVTEGPQKFVSKTGR